MLGPGHARHCTDDVYVEVLVLFARPTTSVCDRNRDGDANAACAALGTVSPSVLPMLSIYLFRSFSPSRDAMADYASTLNVSQLPSPLAPLVVAQSTCTSPSIPTRRRRQIYTCIHPNYNISSFQPSHTADCSIAWRESQRCCCCSHAHCSRVEEELLEFKCISFSG
jgi:hypothetical protein